MFRFTRKPSSGSKSQYLAKTTHLVQCGDVEFIQDFISVMAASGVPRNFVREGVQQIQLRTENRENGDLGAVAP